MSRERYAIREEIARGGMGRILTAIDQRRGCLVAVKEMIGRDPARARRFYREALITSRLRHRGIVEVHEAGHWPDGSPFFVMQFVQGTSLSAHIAETPRLGNRLALLPYVHSACRAIAYAHEQGIVHRDLKPSNIVARRDGQSVVIDWGVARPVARTRDPRAGSSVGTGPLTVDGAVVGTPSYMPPEQARAEAVDERADVYALGAVLYCLVTGAPPYEGRTAEHVLERVRVARPIKVARHAPDAPARLCAIIERAMAPCPDRRYPTAGHLAAELARM